MTTILVTCAGNLCRSPMAAALLQQALVDAACDAEWQVRSAGLWAVDGQPATFDAVAMMKERGYDISDHRSQALTADAVAESDLILCMTPHHVEALRLAFPQAARRIHLLAAMADEIHGIEDPYGLPRAAYRAVADELERLITAGVEQIVDLARSAPDG